jgi:lipoate-protein ligase A
LVARRLSGGGAVFHDDGNLNFSFILNVPKGNNISYKTVTNPIVRFLVNSGLDIEISGRNDIMSKGKKISGSAMHLYKNRALVHATLLIDSNLNDLSNALKGTPDRYTDKSINSKRSKVMNLSEIDNRLTSRIVLTELVSFLAKETGFRSDSTALIDENETINKLVSEKFATPDWIYGYSPKYKYTSEISIDNQLLAFSIEVEKGIIESVYFHPEVKVTNTINLELNKLKGERHNIYSLNELLNKYSNKSTISTILSALF